MATKITASTLAEAIALLREHEGDDVDVVDPDGTSLYPIYGEEPGVAIGACYADGANAEYYGPLS